MAEDKMPATEADEVVDVQSLEEDAEIDDEQNHYELAFHILPTVAEGEVSGVFETLKNSISKVEGELTGEEAPMRVDLAYEIQKVIEGEHRKFTSAYFGWVRFKLTSDLVTKLTEEIDESSDILRYLLIRLTKAEEAHPFRFHEALKSEKMVTTVGKSDVVPDITTVNHKVGVSLIRKEDDTVEAGEVKEKELDESLERITGGEDVEK